MKQEQCNFSMGDRVYIKHIGQYGVVTRTIYDEDIERWHIYFVTDDQPDHELRFLDDGFQHEREKKAHNISGESDREFFEEFIEKYVGGQGWDDYFIYNPDDENYGDDPFNP